MPDNETDGHTRRIIRPTVIIRAVDLQSYLSFRAQGYTTLWVGEGKMCLEAPPTDGRMERSKDDA
jgi:hypothetical protein